MRFLLAAAAVALGCGGGSTVKGAKSANIPAAARSYTAARWIPGKPTYAFAARTVRDLQRSAKDVIESFGIIGDVELSVIGSALSEAIGVDPLSPEAVSAIGVDLDGGVAVFSETINPTLVVHLRSTDQMQGFLEGARSKAGGIGSQLVEGDEMFTATVWRKTKLSWVISGDWMWVHVALPGAPDDGTRWYKPSKHPGAAQWGNDWAWAQKSAQRPDPTFLGILDLRGLVASSQHVKSALACLHQLDPIGHLAFSIEGDGNAASARLALDVGAAAAGVQSALLPPPEGWATVADKAPIAAQWNLDLFALRDWLRPCASAVDLASGLDWIDSWGVRTARAIIRELEPDGPSGSGVTSADLASNKRIAALLDKPGRSLLESSRRFGPWDGKQLAIPFGPKIDYVLTDKLALFGLGDGVLARAVGKGPGAATSTIFALDLTPNALPKPAWEWLFKAIDVPNVRRTTERLLRWRDAHLGLLLDGTRLVFEARGNRR